MKVRKSQIFRLVASVIALIFVIAVLIVGMSSGGFDLFGHTEIPEKNMKEFGVKYSYEIDKISGIDIDWISGNVLVKIVPSGDEVKIVEYSNKQLKEDEKLLMTASGKTLSLKWKDEFVSVSIFNNLTKNLYIEIPKSLADKMSVVNIRTVSGDITAGEMNTESFSLNSTSGDIFVSDVTAESASINNTSGAIEVDDLAAVHMELNSTSGSIEGKGLVTDLLEINSTSGSTALEGKITEIDANAVSGSISVHDLVCPEKADFNSVSGGIVLIIPEDSGFSLNHDTVSGSTKSDFEKASGTDKKFVHGDGKSKLNFDTTSGSVQLKKQ